MKSQSIYRRSTSTCQKQNDGNREFYISAIENQYCVSICAYNEQTSEVYITQYLDCTTFRVTSSTILRFAPKILISTQGNEKSIFFKQLEDELGDTLIYFIPQHLLQNKIDLQKYEQQLLKPYQLQICLNCLIYAVSQHLNIQITKLPIQFYNIKDVLVFNKLTTQSLSILELTKQFKLTTNGGRRLLKANLLQPFSVHEQIIQRQQQLKQILNYSDQQIATIKIHLQKFRIVDTLAQQQQQKIKLLIDQLQQIFRLYNYTKDIINLNIYLKGIQLQSVMGVSLQNIIESQEFIQVKYDIEQIVDTSLLITLSNNSEEDILYFILKSNSESIEKGRQTIIETKKQINILHQKYLGTFNVQVKCSKIKNKKNSIQCLRNGFVFEITIQEANKHNINELDIKRICIQEGDSVNFIDKYQQKYQILTDKLAQLNLQLDNAINIIMNETQNTINTLYESLQLKCSWIFEMNQFISQLDLLICLRDYAISLGQKHFTFPIFSNYFEIKEGKSLKNTFDKISIQFNGFNIIYDYKQCLSEQLKQIGQYIILAQIGCPLPCIYYQQILLTSLYTHFQKYTVQNLAERQSSFTAEITSLTNILQSDLQDSLVICDSLAISSSHETNISFNLSYLEQLNKKIQFGLIGSNEGDTMQIVELIHCNQLLSKNDEISLIDQQEFENILDQEFNTDYKQALLDQLYRDLKFPQEFCQIMQMNFFGHSQTN